MGGKILLVDDDKDYRDLIEMELRKRGYTVVGAGDGEEGLEKAGTENPDLIITDIKMPKMDGYTFARSLKKDEVKKKIPLIVMTSYEPMKDMFKMEGYTDYYVKSSDIKELCTIIERNLKQI